MLRQQEEECPTDCVFLCVGSGSFLCIVFCLCFLRRRVILADLVVDRCTYFCGTGLKGQGSGFFMSRSTTRVMHWDRISALSVKVGVLRPVQQPGSYWDRSSELPLVGLEPTEVTAYD